jgi:spore coat polysaccharide biosynthesis predicted glycosyltransferase SpsG
MIVLLGANAVNAGRVICFCSENNIAVERGLSDVTPLMNQAKMAVSAAGGTLFELACIGVPTVFAQVAENQTRSLEQHVPLGWCHSIRFDNILIEEQQAIIEELVTLVNQQWLDQEWQQQARNVAQCLVDGKGAWRVAQTVDSYFSCMI